MKSKKKKFSVKLLKVGNDESQALSVLSYTLHHLLAKGCKYKVDYK